MGKGIPELEKHRFEKEDGIFSSTEMGNISVLKMEMSRLNSIKDVGNQLGGVLIMDRGDVILTIGGSVIELSSNETLRIPKGFYLNIKAKEDSVIYLVEKSA